MKRCVSMCSLVLIFALLLGVLSSCAAAESDFAYAPALDAPAPAAEAPADSEWFDSAPVPAPAPAPVPDSSGASGQPSLSDESAIALPILTPSDSRGRRIVYTVEMQLQTTEFMAGIRKLVTTVGEMNGFIVNAYVQGHDLRTPEFERSASYTFRLHTDRLAEFIVIMEDSYNLLHFWQASDDVTMRHEHGAMTLDDLREQEARIIIELDDPDLRASDKRNLERTLADVRSSIRNFETQQATMDDDVLYSTIQVHLFEVIFVDEIEEDELTFGERFSQAVSRSWAGFVAFLQGFAIFFIRALPTLVILGAITVVTVLIIRKYRAWRLVNPKKQKPVKTTTHPNYQNWSGTNQYYDPNWNYSDPNAQNAATSETNTEKSSEDDAQ